MRIKDLQLKEDEFDLDNDDDAMDQDDGGVSMMSQLMKVADSDDSDDIKNPVRTVTTDDGETIEVSNAEAVGMIELLKMPGKPEQKRQLMKVIQTAQGFQKMRDFAKSKGLI